MENKQYNNIWGKYIYFLNARNIGGFITFLSQPNRLVFLEGSEIQPSSLESNEWRKNRKVLKYKNTKTFNCANHLKANIDISCFGGTFFKKKGNSSSVIQKGKAQDVLFSGLRLLRENYKISKELQFQNITSA